MSCELLAVESLEYGVRLSHMLQQRRHELLYDKRVASQRQAILHGWKDIPCNKQRRQDDVNMDLLDITGKEGYLCLHFLTNLP